jgi:hypothetical protein
MAAFGLVSTLAEAQRVVHHADIRTTMLYE